MGLEKVKSLIKKSNKAVTPKEIGISLQAVDDCTVIGKTNPEMPRIINRLKLLLHRALPTMISEYPSTDPITLTTNSGADVPKATMVKPIARSDTLNFLAKEEAPSTRAFAPKIKQINPRMMRSIWMIMIDSFNP